MTVLIRFRWLLIGALAAAFLVLLAIRPLAENDEYRYAEIGREILVSGNWVAPTLSGIRYFEKPALGYWLNAVSLQVLGENPLAARMPMVLCTVLTGLFLAFFIRRVLGATAPAALTVFVYLSCLFVWAVGSIAILDPLFALPVTLAIGCYYLAYGAATPASRRAWLALVGVACGAAFLIKGFLGLALPVLVVGPFLAWRREWRRLLTDPWLPILVALAVVLPWALLINAREPDFWRYFFWEEHIRRFFGKDEAQHARPVWFFLAALPALALPWTFALPAAVAGLRRRAGEGPLQLYLCLWFAVPFAFLSLSSGKLLTYVLPCFPPAALLVALGLQRYCAAGPQALLRRGAVLCAAFLLAAAGFLVANRFGVGKALFAPPETFRWLLGTGAVLAGAGIAALAARQALRAEHRPWLLGLTLLGIFLALPLALPERVRASKMPGEFLTRLAVLAPDAVLVSHGSLIRSVSWTFRRTDVYVLDPGELRYGLSYPDSRHRLVDAAGVAGLIRDNAGRRDVLIIAPKRELDGLRPYLPDPRPLDGYGEDLAWLIPARPGGS